MDSGSLQASFWFMIVLNTLGAVDMPGRGTRKMPSPRAYLATIITWSVLQLGADAGYERPTSVMGWIIVLAGLVLGPFGKRIANLFTTAANITTGAASP